MPGFLALTCENPSAIDASGGEHRQKRCANHCNEAGDDRSTVAPKAYGIHRESTHYATTNAHEGVHKRSIPITLKNPSGSPANDCSNDDPCK